MKKLCFLILSCLCFFIYNASAQSFSVVNLGPGYGTGSYPYGMTTFNSKVYFAADPDTMKGYELYVSDGTVAGTSLIKDINPGPSHSYPSNFIAMGNQLFFTADDGVHGTELWVTDGTSAGTVMLDDIWPGPSSGMSGYPYFTILNGKLYFAAADSLHGTELWVTDGTPVGTSLVKDIWPGLIGSNIYAVGAGNGYGVSGYSYHMTEWNGKLYFEADDGIHGEELWATDGTTAGTTLIADIWAGPGNSFPYCITAFGNKLIMGAADSLHGQELWVSDGTAAGTSLLKDINPGMSSSIPGDYATFNLFNGKLYFDAITPSYGDELWVTDGTSAGTQMVADIWPGPTSSTPGAFGIVVYNNTMYLSASDSIHGDQLWTSDGTGAGTTLFKVLSSYVPNYSQPQRFILYDGKMIFIANTDSINQEQLFSSDGTVGGTGVISPAISPNTDPMGYYSNFCVANNSLFMDADFNSVRHQLWVYGFPLGITPVSGDNTITAYPNPFSTSVTLSGVDPSQHYTVEVLDMSGRVYYNAQYDPSETIVVSMPDLTSGVYLMHVSGQGSTQTFKLVRN